MTKEEEKKFDSQIRSILGDAREDVPEGLWPGIEQRLAAGGTISDNGNAGRADHVRKHRTIPIWIRISSVAAAAAAVAAVMFVSGTFDDVRSEGHYDRLADTQIAEDVNIAGNGEKPGLHAGQTDIARAMAQAAVRTENNGTTDSFKAAAGNTEVNVYPSTAFEAAEPAYSDTPDSHTASGVENDEKEDLTEISETDTEIAEESGQTGNAVLQDSDRTGADTGSDDVLWKELLENESKQKIRTSITLSGNAISNTNSAVNRDASAPVSYRPNKNTPKKDMVSESGESSYSVPVSLGIGVKIDFTQRWALGVGVNYTHLSRTFAGTFFDYEGDVLVSDNTYSNIINRQDYVGIPLNVYFSILKNNFIDFYAYAGGSVEKCLSNKFTMTADGAGIHHSEPVSGFQFSANAGIGMEFIIADTFGIYLDPSLRYYFPDARQPRSIRTDQPLMLGLELGFRIRL